MKRMQEGLTYVGLILVVIVIGILAAVAIPQYNDYPTKVKLSKANEFAVPIKTALAAYFVDHNSFPAATSAWTSLGFPTAPKPINEVSAVTVTASTGAIVITLANILPISIDGTTIAMTPTVGEKAITWAIHCTSTNVTLKKYFTC